MRSAGPLGSFPPAMEGGTPEFAKNLTRRKGGTARVQTLAPKSINCSCVARRSVSRLLSGAGLRSLNRTSSRFSINLNWCARSFSAEDAFSKLRRHWEPADTAKAHHHGTSPQICP